MGVLMVGLASGTAGGAAGATYQLVDHAAVQVVAVPLCRGDRAHDRRDNGRRWEGSVGCYPLLAGAFTVGVLAIAGMSAPTGGLTSFVGLVTSRCSGAGTSCRPGCSARATPVPHRMGALGKASGRRTIGTISRGRWSSSAVRLSAGRHGDLSLVQIVVCGCMALRPCSIEIRVTGGRAVRTGCGLLNTWPPTPEAVLFIAAFADRAHRP